MIKTQNGEIYENQIEQLFLEFFREQNIDVNKDTIKQTKFKACFMYIYKHLFKPDNTTVRHNNKTSKLDYKDIDTLNDVLDIFNQLCFNYNVIPSKNNFSVMTGISIETLSNWKRQENRIYIYYDKNGNKINDICEWKLNNKGEYTKKVSYSHYDFVVKIENNLKDFYRSNLTDSTVGQITIANNDDEVGLLYAQKEARAKAEAWGRQPRLSRSEVLGIDVDDGDEDGEF